jgi:hypothetical protein
MSQSHFDRPITRRAALAALLGGGAAAVTGCTSSGQFSFLGYTTAPNYDPEIRTVYVPLFGTRFVETSPYRGMEFTLTRAVVDAINSKTTMRVVDDPHGADTELQGMIAAMTKQLVNRTPYNEAREITLTLSVEIVWHDLRPGHEGKILTNPKRRDPGGVAAPEIPFDPGTPPAQVKPDLPQATILKSVGRSLPEMGESNTTGLQMAINRMAIQVIEAMEQPW